MIPDTDIAIIGAGPYGLSLAAHLAAAGQTFRIFGRPMQFWREHMPEGMVLKSEGFASSLWHPDGALTLKEYCRERHLPYQDTGLPVPLQVFCDYGQAFQQRFVPALDQRQVTRLEQTGAGFTLRLEDGQGITAGRVVVAAGIGAFRYVPRELDAITGPMCTHSMDHHVLAGFAGREVLVIGGGASGVELAALISETGGQATVAARAPRIAFCGAPRPRSLWEKIKAPETGLGYGWRSLACVYAPLLFHRMPQGFRHMVVRRHLGPAPGWTSRAAVERNVRVILNAHLLSAGLENGRPAVTLRVGGAAEQTVVADHVIAATGFRVDLRRLGFVAPELLAQVEQAENTPVLSPQFETSVPGLFMVGIAAANSFGPLLRFAYGAGFTSRRLSRHLARTRVRQAGAVSQVRADGEPRTAAAE